MAGNWPWFWLCRGKLENRLFGALASLWSSGMVNLVKPGRGIGLLWAGGWQQYGPPGRVSGSWQANWSIDGGGVAKAATVGVTAVFRVLTRGQDVCCLPFFIVFLFLLALNPLLKLHNNRTTRVPGVHCAVGTARCIDGAG